MSDFKMFDDFASISRAKETWRILVKVIRARKGQRLSGRKLAFTLEVVLMDNKIHATIREGLIYRFERVLKEGHVYAITNFEVSFNAGPFMTDKHEFKINFQMNIEVKPMNKASITIETYTFVPLSDILYEDYDTDYLDDVIGFLTGVGTERVIDKEYVKTKMNTIEIESECCNTTSFLNLAFLSSSSISIPSCSSVLAFLFQPTSHQSINRVSSD
ncbi:uncharacterized protein LOC130743416 isoform X3 [Lotus japonicus]|uniref:uncharacterized protein LOC130743416 isoform X3 n=1 Tax=Lotus japonicus TaxID=34305 RepID=UPI00258F0165|nr:uncharacterized protein LOC130743416 isoform X3 [Lotus japonicus]